MQCAKLLAMAFISGAICGPTKSSLALSMRDANQLDTMTHPVYGRDIAPSKPDGDDDYTVADPDYKRQVTVETRDSDDDDTVAYPEYKR